MSALLSWKTIPMHDFLVVHGYVHQQLKNLTLFIPDDLLNYLVIWYYDVSTWKISGSELTKFFSLKNGEAIYSKPFKVDGITFHCSLCPMGWKSNQNGFVQYYLEVKHIPSNISSFTVYFEFYCYETKSSWKGIRTLTKKNDAVGWFHYTLPLEECKEMLSTLNLNHITFGCCVEILTINYLVESNDTNEYKESDEMEKTQKIRSIQSRNLKLNRQIQKTWILNKYPLQRFKLTKYPKNFHSPSWGNNYWCFECQANFEHNIMFYCRLKLIRMPFHIKMMKIKCNLQTNMEPDTKKEDRLNVTGWDVVDLSFNHNYTKWRAFITRDKEENSIRISVKIEILSLINWDGVAVDISEWNKYGILKNDYSPSLSIQYSDIIEQNGKNQMLTNLEYENRELTIKKEWIKPNFLNVPM